MIGKCLHMNRGMYYVLNVDICIVRCVIILMVECEPGDMKRMACLVSGVRNVLMEPLGNEGHASLKDHCENGN